jgi:hypothetical protein
MLLISSEVKHGTRDYGICKAIWKRHPVNSANLEVFCRQSGANRSGQAPHMLHSFGVHVEREHLAAFTKKIDEISSIATSGIENAHARCEVPAQNLVEDIDVNLSKLLLKAESHLFIISASDGLVGLIALAASRKLVRVLRGQYVFKHYGEEGVAEYGWVFYVPEERVVGVGADDGRR